MVQALMMPDKRFAEHPDSAATCGKRQVGAI